VQHHSATTTAPIARDLAISAVTTDAGFVSELIADIQPLLPTSPAWHTEPAVGDSAQASAFADASTRVVVILYHHLWLHDETVQRDDVPLLRARLLEHPDSVCVLSLDGTPLPPWLRAAARYDLVAAGRDGTIGFIAGIVAAAGCAVKAGAGEPAAEPAPMRWSDQPTPFLSQQRAQSALRHELDALAEELETIVGRSRTTQPERMFELQVMPQRMVARLDDVAVTFSWLAGRTANVSDGSLLVIGWRGVNPGLHGVAALRSAAVIHERSYVADGDAPNTWRWRSVDSVAHPYSSANLVAEWMARASLAQAS
jgi:hypothetical protein